MTTWNELWFSNHSGKSGSTGQDQKPAIFFSDQEGKHARKGSSSVTLQSKKRWPSSILFKKFKVNFIWNDALKNCAAFEFYSTKLRSNLDDSPLLSQSKERRRCGRGRCWDAFTGQTWRHDWINDWKNGWMEEWNAVSSNDYLFTVITRSWQQKIEL